MEKFKRIGVVSFTISFILLIVIHIFFNLFMKQMPPLNTLEIKSNEDLIGFIVLFVIWLLINIFFIVNVYIYGKNNSFSKNRYIVVYLALAISMFLFPILLQIFAYVCAIIYKPKIE